MRLDDQKFAGLLLEIENVEEISQLRSLRDHFQQTTQFIEQLSDIDNIVQWYERINSVHDIIITKAIYLAEQSMIGGGLGSPPTAYCYLLLGSGGREEQTLASDQDSALIYQDVAASESTRQYFMQLANYIVSNLEQVGYPPCDGKIQSNQPLWCQSVMEWKKQLDTWIVDASWEAIRYLLIYTDARAVYGNDELYYSVRKYYADKLKSNPQILRRMIDNTIQYRMLTGIFGQFITDQYGETIGSIDIKYGGYIPFVNAIRWLSINEDIWPSSTLKRLDQLLYVQAINEVEYEELREAFLQLLMLRILAGHRQTNGFYESYGKVNPKRLDKKQIKKLKKSLRTGTKLQKKIMKYSGKRGRTV